MESGAVLALGLVISAFAYAPAEYRIERSPMEYGNADVIELTEITRDRPKEVQPRKVEIRIPSQVIRIMDNGTQIQTDVDLSIFDVETPIEFVTPTAEPAVEDEIFLIAEKIP